MTRSPRIASAFLIPLLAGLAMIGPFTTDTYLPSFPSMAHYFGVSPVLIQQTLSVYLFAYAVMTLVYGTLSDSFGRRRVILGALLLFTAASIGAMLARSFEVLLLFRAMQGACAGAGMVVGQAIIRDTFEGAAAARAMANVMMIFGVAPAIAPVVGGILESTTGWRGSFGLMAGLGAVLLAGCGMRMAESLPTTARQPFHLISLAKNYGVALRHPQFVFGILAVSFSFGGFAIYISSAAPFILHILDLSPTSFAWLFVPMIGGMVIGSALMGKLAHQYSNTVFVRFGFSVMALAAVWNLAYTALFEVRVPFAVLPIMLSSFGLAFVMPSMSIVNLNIFPSMRGLAASLQSFFQMMVFALISGFVAPLLFHSAFMLAFGGAIFLAGSYLCWTLADLSFQTKNSLDDVHGQLD